MNILIQEMNMNTVVVCILSYVFFLADSVFINIESIGYENSRNVRLIIRVEKNMGFLMCARECEKEQECTGFNYWKANLLCEILTESYDAIERKIGWRYVNKLDWLQENAVSTNLRGNACSVRGRNTLLSNGVSHCNRERLPVDCEDVASTTSISSGVYHIDPTGNKTMTVYCDFVTDGGGWTVFQARKDGSVDFFRNWDDYKNGFGSVEGEFWLGNENLHILLSTYNYTLRIDMEHFDGRTRFAEYTQFTVEGADQKYFMTVGGYSGDAGDAFSYMSGSMFSTKDQDNDAHGSTNCALASHGGSWYKACHSSNPNGRYYPTALCDYGVGITWRVSVGGHQISMKAISMKLKRRE